MNPSIVLIGAGNVGTHLGKRFHEVGISVQQVFSRTKGKAQILARAIDSISCTDLKKITDKADIYILAVHDDAIQEVAEQLAFLNDSKRLLVHTSGATPSTVFKGIFKNYGIFYPLQSFSIHRKADFSNIPICIDAKYKKDINQLEVLAKSISPKVYFINDDQRAVLHVAAVFVNNFSNYLFHIGESICKKEQVDFEILRPLIQETVAKIQHQSPATMQTGPAIRGDEVTIQKHLDYLQKDSDYQTIYQLITEQIQSNLNS